MSSKNLVTITFHTATGLTLSIDAPKDATLREVKAQLKRQYSYLNTDFSTGIIYVNTFKYPDNATVESLNITPTSFVGIRIPEVKRLPIPYPDPVPIAYPDPVPVTKPDPVKKPDTTSKSDTELSSFIELASSMGFTERQATLAFQKYRNSERALDALINGEFSDDGGKNPSPPPPNPHLSAADMDIIQRITDEYGADFEMVKEIYVQSGKNEDLTISLLL